MHATNSKDINDLPLDPIKCVLLDLYVVVNVTSEDILHFVVLLIYYYYIVIVPPSEMFFLRSECYYYTWSCKNIEVKPLFLVRAIVPKRIMLSCTKRGKVSEFPKRGRLET